MVTEGEDDPWGMGRGFRKKRGQSGFTRITKATRMSCCNNFPKIISGIESLPSAQGLPLPSRLPSHRNLNSPEAQVITEEQIPTNPTQHSLQGVPEPESTLTEGPCLAPKGK